MIMFKVDTHSIRLGRQTVEITSGGTLLATITPGDDEQTIRIHSKYNINVSKIETDGIQTLNVRFT